MVDRRRVKLHCALVGQPQQRSAVIAQCVRHVALRRLSPQLHSRHPRRRVLGKVLLHERALAGPHPDHRQRPVGERRDHPVGDSVEIIDQIALRRIRALEQRLIEVRQLDAVRTSLVAIAPSCSPSQNGWESFPDSVRREQVRYMAGHSRGALVDDDARSRGVDASGSEHVFGADESTECLRVPERLREHERHSRIHLQPARREWWLLSRTARTAIAPQLHRPLRRSHRTRSNEW